MADRPAERPGVTGGTAYELSQLVPLAVIVVIGVVFCALGRGTRQAAATEPVTAGYHPADP